MFVPVLKEKDKRRTSASTCFLMSSAVLRDHLEFSDRPYYYNMEYSLLPSPTSASMPSLPPPPSAMRVTNIFGCHSPKFGVFWKVRYEEKG